MNLIINHFARFSTLRKLAGWAARRNAVAGAGTELSFNPCRWQDDARTAGTVMWRSSFGV